MAVEVASSVKYVHLDTTEPLQVGFDSMVGVEGERANEDGLELAVSWKGICCLSKRKAIIGLWFYVKLKRNTLNI